MIKKVYIFIEVGYQWGQGMPKANYVIFENCIKKILTDLGFSRWFRTLSCSSLECVRNEEETLYCHPMDLVGYLHDDKIQPIVEAIKNSENIQFRHVDIYDMEEKDWKDLERTLTRKGQEITT